MGTMTSRRPCPDYPLGATYETSNGFCECGGSHRGWDVPRAMFDGPCMARGEQVARYAARVGIVGREVPFTALVWRLAWDAPAAGEYPRPMMQDAADLAHVRPDLAARVWHHAAGATILGAYCCGAPAHHRDALTDLARELRATYGGQS